MQANAAPETGLYDTPCKHESYCVTNDFFDNKMYHSGSKGPLPLAEDFKGVESFCRRRHIIFSKALIPHRVRYLETTDADIASF